VQRKVAAGIKVNFKRNETRKRIIMCYIPELPGEGVAVCQFAGSLPEASAAVEILCREPPVPSGPVFIPTPYESTGQGQ